MHECHLIQIEHQALFSAAQEAKAQPNAFYAKLGEKVYRLCENYLDPIKPREMPCESLGISMPALAWRGFATSAYDEVFYWGSTLKKLRSVSDAELKLAAKRISDEMERRAQPKKTEA